MSTETARQFPLDRWQPSRSPPSAKHLNQAVDMLRAMSQGVGAPSVTEQDDYTLDIPPQFLRARLLLTDAARGLSGLAAIDGVTPNDGDYILRSTGGTPGLDGLYRASAGAWNFVARLNYAQDSSAQFGPGRSPVYPHGAIISIWDGNNSPAEVQASVSGLVTF